MALDYRPDIDGLRAVAVLPVVAFHLGIGAFGGGYVGVDVFFVISGYLITSLILSDLQSGAFSFRVFYFRRIRRIAPALFVVFAATTIAAWIVFFPSDMADFAQSLVASTIVLANVHFADQFGYFDRGAEFAPLLHTWSLSIEEQYYLIFPLLLALAWRSGIGRAFVLVGTLGALSFLYSAFLVASGPPESAFFSSFGRFWEIFAGALLALAGHRVRLPSRFADGAAILGLALIILPVFLYRAQTPFPGLAALVPVLGTALIIAAGTAGSSWVGRVLSLPPIVLVGRISYSLYLWHWPIIVLHRHLMIPLDNTQRLIIFAASLGLAWLTWRFVERPARRLEFTTWGPRTASAFAASAALTVSLGLYVFYDDGAPWRLQQPGLADGILQARHVHPRWRDCIIKPGKDPHDAWCALPEDADRQRPDFLVWGDSHATALLPAVDRLSSAHGTKGFMATAPGCAPLLGVWPDNGFTACRAFNDDMITYLKTAAPMRVILVGHWSIYAEGTRAVLQTPAPPVFLTDDAATRGDRKRSRQLFRDGLERTLAGLTPRHEVYVVKQVHSYRDPVPVAMAAEIRFGSHFEKTSRAGYDALVGYTSTTIDALADKYGATVIDPASLLCPQGQCLYARSGTPLFFDGSHLSTAGALFIEPLMVEPFRHRPLETSGGKSVTRTGSPADAPAAAGP